MSDRLYLSCWIPAFSAENMLDHFGKLLEVFPESKLARRNPILRVYAVEYVEPPVVERPFELDSDVDDVLSASREFAGADCSVEVETAWDLWQFTEAEPESEAQAREAEPVPEDADAGSADLVLAAGAEPKSGANPKLDWRVAPSPVRIICMGPEFDNDEGDNLRIDFGLDSQFLPTPGVESSLAMQQSNLRSLVTLVSEIGDAMELKSRQLWSESGLNFADVLAEAVQEFGPN